MITVINYCSNDSRFIKKNIEECLKFSDAVIIVASTHFFDGEKDENLVKSVKEFADNQKIHILIYDWSPGNDPRFYHNLSRWYGYKYAMQKYNQSHILFLDADEVPDGNLIKQYLLTTNDIHQYDVLQFACYYYFREPTYRAKTISGCGALWKTDKIHHRLFFTDKERWGYRYARFFNFPNIPYKEEVTDISRNIMMHHYSWVRTKEEMLKKVASWGEKDLKNWVPLVQEEFSREFTGRCFVHDWEYQTVSNFLE